MKTLEIILEKEDGEIYGRVKAPGFLYITTGETTETITANLKELIADYLEHEGKVSPEWAGITVDDIAFEYTYDLTAFFDLFNELKMGPLAQRAGINESLMRQYASGNKHPSAGQVKKIEQAVQHLGQTLQGISFA